MRNLIVNGTKLKFGLVSLFVGIAILLISVVASAAVQTDSANETINNGYMGPKSWSIDPHRDPGFSLGIFNSDARFGLARPEMKSLIAYAGPRERVHSEDDAGSLEQLDAWFVGAN